MNEQEICNTTLGLGIGTGTGTGVEIKREKQLKNKKIRGFWLDLSLPLHPKIEASDDEKDDHDSFSSKTDDERTIKKSISNTNVYNNDVHGSRKKLKLTEEQTTLLEDSFNIRSTLNTGQKQELAKKLNLLPRQIEVWYQNRRARTKLKQIEQECELLKKYCETLNDENCRLKKELEKVRCCSLKLDHHHHQPTPQPFYIRYPITTAVHYTDEDKKTMAVVDDGIMRNDIDDEDSNKKNATATKLL